MKKIALCLIVKNESAVITRCLDSAKPFVDYVFIEDTGSEDGTQNIVRAWLQANNMEGEIYDHAWQNFAYNRSHVLQQLRLKSEIDYALMIDADDLLLLDNNLDIAALKSDLDADIYELSIKREELYFYRPQLLSNHLPFSYRGVLHEFLELPEGQLNRKTLAGVCIDARTEGARSLDPHKYERDAELLKAALESEEDPFMRSRYMFYLAQSLRDSGQTPAAIDSYLKRADMGFWDEERYVALVQAARLMAVLGSYTDEEVEKTYCRAIALKPERLEAVSSYGRYLRLKEQYHRAVALLTPYLGKAVPESGLFLEPYAYHIEVWDEYAVSAYWCKDFKACLRACLHLLKRTDLEPNLRKRVSANADFALGQL